MATTRSPCKKVKTSDIHVRRSPRKHLCTAEVTEDSSSNAKKVKTRRRKAGREEEPLVMPKKQRLTGKKTMEKLETGCDREGNSNEIQEQRRLEDSVCRGKQTRRKPRKEKFVKGDNELAVEKELERKSTKSRKVAMSSTVKGKKSGVNASELKGEQHNSEHCACVQGKVSATKTQDEKKNKYCADKSRKSKNSGKSRDLNTSTSIVQDTNLSGSVRCENQDVSSDDDDLPEAFSPSKEACRLTSYLLYLLNWACIIISFKKYVRCS